MRKDTDPCHDTDPSHPTHKYALDVVSGKIVAGPHVRAACKRHLDDLKTAPSRGFYFSAEKADYAIEFFPTVLELASEDHPQGFPFDLEPVGQFMVGSLFGWVNEAGFRRFRTAYIEMGKGNAKALSIDTPIPTPFGWSSMGDIAIGDIVFGSDGKQCRVIAATDTMYDRECYRLTFDDGERIIADAGHLWCTTSTEKKTKDKNIRTTKEIANTLRRKNGQYQTANHSVDICKPIECCEANLDINPYTFGMWIGDGDSDCGRITCGTNDLDETIYNLQNDGCVITSVVKTNTAWRVTISGLKTKLRDIGVLCNKMIPVKYMRASSMQRLELLRGLMDSDGTASKAGQCTFSSKNRGIAECVYELVNSLGIKAFLSSKKASIGATVYADAHCVSFFPPDAVDVFRLKRKACRKPKSHGRVKLSATRRIVACEQVDSVPVRCITVDARDSLYLCGNGMVPTHNSPLAAGIGMFGLLADGVPNAEIYAAASKRDQAMILFKDAVSFVERSEFLQDVIKTSGKRPNVWSLFHLESKSEFKPISSDDGQSGYRPHIALVDELHEHKNSVVVNMLTAGQKGLRQPLVFIITNSGSDVNTVCGEYHKNAIEIAHGITKDDAFFSYVCALDEGDDPFADESCWIKTNPMLGVTIQNEYIRNQIASATMPSKRSEVKRLNFCIWTQADNPFIDYDAWAQARSKFSIVDLRSMECCMGLDLSQVRDLTAAVFSFRSGETVKWWPEFWIPEGVVAQKVKEDKIPYDTWIDKGWVRTTPGNSISLEFIARDIKQIIEDNDLTVTCLMYDRWRIEDFKIASNAVGLDVEEVMKEHGQGFKDMSPALDAFERDLVNRKFQHPGNPCLDWCAANAVVAADPAGGRKLDKGKNQKKRIDGIIAGVMSHHATSLQAESSAPDIRWL